MVRSDKTFLEEYENVNKKYGDQGQPSAKENLGSCIHCPKLSFFSKTEKKRHESVFHRRQSTNIRIRANSYKCNFETCGEVFGSPSALSRHKIKTNHRARDGGASTEISAKRRKTTKSKRRPMNLAEFRQKANRFSSSSSEEEEIEEVSLGRGYNVSKMAYRVQLYKQLFRVDRYFYFLIYLTLKFAISS